MQKIGLIGVGLMGHGIGKNIAAKGWDLRFLHHAGNQPTDDLIDLGAARHDTAADLAKACDILILCVTGSPQVEDILIGSGAVLKSLRPGTIVVDCSTAIPSSTRALATKVRAVGCELVDAAMTRTPKEAEEGRLNLLVGGAGDTIAKVRPVLESFAENIFVAGGSGSDKDIQIGRAHV